MTPRARPSARPSQRQLGDRDELASATDPADTSRSADSATVSSAHRYGPPIPRPFAPSRLISMQSLGAFVPPVEPAVFGVREAGAEVPTTPILRPRRDASGRIDVSGYPGVDRLSSGERAVLQAMVDQMHRSAYSVPVA